MGEQNQQVQSQPEQEMLIQQEQSQPEQEQNQQVQSQPEQEQNQQEQSQPELVQLLVQELRAVIMLVQTVVAELLVWSLNLRSNKLRIIILQRLQQIQHPQLQHKQKLTDYHKKWRTK